MLKVAGATVAATALALTALAPQSVSAAHPSEERDVEGVLHVVAVEQETPDDAIAPHRDHDDSHSRPTTLVTLITADERIPIVGDLLDGAVSGTEFRGTLTGNVAQADAAEVLEATLTPPTAAAVAPKQHTVDVMYLTASGFPSPTTADVNGLTSRLNEYWPSQTGGQISGFARKSTFRTAKVSKATACSPYSAWDYASGPNGFNRAEQWPGSGTDSYYWGASRSVHLIVLVPSELCPSGGLGSIAQIHTGGTVWASVPNDARDWDGTVFHELGHNLGLGHSNVRECEDGSSDGPRCTDDEYADYYDIMAGGYTLNTTNNYRNLSALNVTHRAQLDALPRGSALREVRASGGQEQTFTLRPVSNNSGLRALEIVDPRTNDKLYVEYRSGTGRDANSFYARLSRESSTAQWSWLEPGVRVLKLLNCDAPASFCPEASSVALPRPQSSTPSDGKTRFAFQAGHVFRSLETPGAPSGVQITVASMNDSQAVVRVAFDPPATAPIVFRDVSANVSSPHYSAFAHEIAWMASSGITTGYNVAGGKEYRPFGRVTRDAMAAFLYRAAGEPAFTAPATSPFIDVKPSQSFYKEITWLASTGITTGWDVGGGKKEFRPYSNITRDAMAAFLYRFAKSPNSTPPSSSPFRDVPKSNAFYKEITWLASTGISTGWDARGGKEFRPFHPITRDAMAAFLYRYADLDG